MAQIKIKLFGAWYTLPTLKGDKGDKGDTGQDGNNNLYIQDEQPTVTIPSLWVQTENGIIKSLYIVTEEEA